MEKESQTKTKIKSKWDCIFNLVKGHKGKDLETRLQFIECSFCFVVGGDVVFVVAVVVVVHDDLYLCLPL